MNLFVIKVNGEVVLEVPVVVHDQKQAWRGFISAFGAISPNIPGEFFETIRRVCLTDPEDLPDDVPPSLLIDIQLVE